MSDNALGIGIALSIVMGLAVIGGSFATYYALKNKTMLEMIRAGADPIKVRALMDGQNVLYVEKAAQ